jgi:hypothetical protein
MIIYNMRTRLKNIWTTASIISWANRCNWNGGETASSDLLNPTMTFGMPKCMTVFKRIPPRSGGHGLANKSTNSLVREMNFMLYVMDFECMCVDLCAT